MGRGMPGVAHDVREPIWKVATLIGYLGIKGNEAIKIQEQSECGPTNKPQKSGQRFPPLDLAS